MRLEPAADRVAAWPAGSQAGTPFGPFGGPQSANQASLLTYCGRPRPPNRDRFGKEKPVVVTKISRNLPSVQVM